MVFVICVMSIKTALPHLKPIHTQTLSTARPGVQSSPDSGSCMHTQQLWQDPIKPAVSSHLQDIYLHRPLLTGFLYTCELDKSGTHLYCKGNCHKGRKPFTEQSDKGRMVFVFMSDADSGFWSGGPVEFGPQGGPEPKICSKLGVFP